MEMQRDGMIEMRGAERWRRYESALHEDETTRGASEMRDADKIVDRGGGSIVRRNESESFSVELLAIDIAADSDE